MERLTRRATHSIVTIKTECITWAAYFLSDTTTTVNLGCGTCGSSSCKSTGGTGIRLANDDPRDVDGSFTDSDHSSKSNDQGKRIHHDGRHVKKMSSRTFCTCQIIIVQSILVVNLLQCSGLRQGVLGHANMSTVSTGKYSF